MSTCFLTDTFPAFLTWWDKARDLSIERQITGWEQEYLAQWPELFQKQADNYAKDKIDWQQIARERIFPCLSERLPDMQAAHDNLLVVYQAVYEKASEKLGLDFDTNFVIHVGVGLGAGWATEYNGMPAVLLGLENIAESGWSGIDAIRRLVAHEIGHLIHYSWRKQEQKSGGSGPWWRLYEEGFAQRAESLIINDQSPFYRKGSDWYDWCRKNQKQLASKFLKTIEKDEPVTAFFGSWYKISGRSETGYYLGYELIKELEKQFSFKDIALLDDIRVYLQPIIGRLSSKV